MPIVYHSLLCDIYLVTKLKQIKHQMNKQANKIVRTEKRKQNSYILSSEVSGDISQ